MKEKLTSIKKFYVKHERKFVYSALSAATAVAVLFRTGIKQHDDFLKEKNLYDEFYTPE